MKKDGIVALCSKFALTTVLLAVACLALACGSSYPSESEARKGLEARYAPFLKVRNFTKTNGMGDDKHYTVNYDVELECLRADDYQMRMGCNEVGQIRKESAKVEFEKTENGWRAIGLP